MDSSWPWLAPRQYQRKDQALAIEQIWQWRWQWQCRNRHIPGSGDEGREEWTATLGCPGRPAGERVEAHVPNPESAPAICDTENKQNTSPASSPQHHQRPGLQPLEVASLQSLIHSRISIDSPGSIRLWRRARSNSGLPFCALQIHTHMRI